MKIFNFNFSNTSTPIKKGTQTNVPYFGITINTLQEDTVSFCGKSKKEKQHNNQKSAFEKGCLHNKKSYTKARQKIQSSIQCFDPAEAQTKRLEKQKAKDEAQLKELETKLEYEHQKAEIRKKYINPNLQSRIKSKLISDNELTFIINKIKDFPELINEIFLEPENGDLLFCLSDNMMQKVLTSTTDYNALIKLISSQDKNEKIFMEKIPEEKIKIFNTALKDFQTVLISAYLTENKNKQIPAHYLSIDNLKMMNELLKEYPAILAQIYTHTDKIGNTPMHNRFKTGQAIIREALAYQPETITRIRKIKNKYDEYPETIIKKAEKYTGPYEEIWKMILNDF